MQYINTSITIIIRMGAVWGGGNEIILTQQKGGRKVKSPTRHCHRDVTILVSQI